MEKLEKHILKYGALTAVGLITFFFLMKLFGLTHVAELRALNALIMFAGVFLAIRKYRDKKFNYSFNYLAGIGTGFVVGMITAVLFSIFVIGYLFVDPAFTASIIEQYPQQAFLNELTLTMVIFIEAMASGFLFAYMSMQYLKRDKTMPLSRPSNA